ncbi:MAG: hypothetical protein IT336_14580 [Thermomicrobiales bacterium]|nr:hypothetical protein [Thermomicrobiales bacterium]
MYSNDPVKEWRARWQAGASALPPPSTPPRPHSLWQISLAAFAGTTVALIGCVALAVGGILVLAANYEFDETPDSLTYRNDTGSDVWVYECVDRCEEFAGWFWLEPGEETSFDLAWYWTGRVDWIVVVNEDTTYGCIELSEWEDQTIVLSTSTDCPTDIHSPTSERM